MAKDLMVLFLVLLMFCCLPARSKATVYNVGGTSGWDLSTDIGSWAQGKTFVTGDVLWFQYASYNNVCELTNENYDVCNTTQPLQTYTGGNTTITLTHSGDWYFACGNQLYCLGGMKLRVNVASNQSATSPAPAPASALHQSGSLPASAKGANVPSTKSPSSSPVFRSSVDVMLLPLFMFLVWNFIES
ncbi:hypothetical protein Droror1_Dr00000673 [Drosera rotundifolia]